MQTPAYPLKQTGLVKPLTEKQQRFIVGLRRELGIATTDLPASSKEGVRLIDALVQRRDARARRQTRQEAAAAPPSAGLAASIEAAAVRLGIEVQVPASSADAGFVLDDLRHRERKARRTADGSGS